MKIAKTMVIIFLTFKDIFESIIIKSYKFYYETIHNLFNAHRSLCFGLIFSKMLQLCLPKL